MANPIYHADPEFYERPGETVHLEVDQHPSMFTVPALPWNEDGMGERMESRFAHDCVDLAIRCGVPEHPCTVCRRSYPVGPSGLCQWCARAQARDETAKARANQPQPSRPRIAIREGWEVFAGEREPAGDASLESGHVRPYETRIG